ncbi:MAG TPA: glycerol-3-phosphate acyltransferase [Deinococcales bacterium]|nr:glycerol-3-phosphate acyltransferase [Deinococcales bacterium]
MNPALLLVLPLAYVLGAASLGYWLARARGKEPRRASPHNVGPDRALRLLGPHALVGALLVDMGKGALAVWLAAPLLPDGGVLVAGFAAYAGHLYPHRVLVGEAYTLRGRGYALLLGVLSGVVALGILPLGVGVLPVLAWAAVLGLTRYLTAATLAGIAVLAVATAFLPFSAEARLAALGLLALAAWRSKENLGRILDRTEPLVGELRPVAYARPDEAVAAFIIHPLNPNDLWKTPRFGWLRPLVERGLLPMRLVTSFASLLRPMKIGELRAIRTLDGKEILCHLLSAPLMPEVFKEKPELAVRRAIQGARLASELGASTFGLGAFFGTVGRKGQDVQAAVPEIHVTNGGAYTAGTVRAAVPAIVEHFKERGVDTRELTAAVVGANGVVAFGMARAIAREVGHVILIGRDPERLERSRATLERAFPGTRFTASLDPHDCRHADLVFTATSDPNPVVYAKDVKPGAWIYDEGRPADVDEGVLAVPGVRLIPGGVVRPPGNMTGTLEWARGSLGFGDGRVPACLAETLIIASNEAWDRASLGDATRTENINYFVEEAERLGFTVVDEPAAPRPAGPGEAARAA